MKSPIQVERFLKLPGIFGPEVLGVAYCKKDGVRLQPLVLIRGPDGHVTMFALDGVCLGPVVRRPDPNNPQWIRWDDPQFSDDFRAQANEIVLAQLRGRGDIA